jgi:Tol biopolymer transport system component
MWLSSVLGLACLVAAAGSSATTETGAGDAATTLESLGTGGVQGNLYSYAAGISADGRYMVFNSDATNLVPGDSNERSDGFVRDRVSGETVRVSVSSSGAQANAGTDPFGGSHVYGIDASGRYVVFVSDASNLVASDTNGVPDVFLHDRVTGATSRVSLTSDGGQADGASGSPAISADGRWVAFVSSASNLTAGDTNRRSDVFVHDRLSGKTQRVSLSSNRRQANGDCEEPAISAHGRYIAFATNASNLVAGDSNRLEDIFVHDRRTGQTRRVSVTSSAKQSAGSPTHSGSNAPSISANGRYVACHSDASNLVSGDTNGVFDVFVHDRRTGQTRRASIGHHGQQANAESLGAPVISGDGRWVAYASLASNLVAHDSNDITDVFLRDRLGHRTLLASLSDTGQQGNDASTPAALTPDGRYLAFTSWAGNLVPHDESPGPDVFVRDLRDARLGHR